MDNAGSPSAGLWAQDNAAVRSPVRGLGRMGELHAIVRPERCSRVEWTTDAPNDGARRFYASLGYAENASKVFYRSML